MLEIQILILGVYDQDKLVYHWRMETDPHKTEDEYAMQVKAFFTHASHFTLNK